MRNRNSTRRTTLLGAAALALLLAVAVACGPNGTTPPPTGGDTAVQVTVDGPGRVVQGSFQCGEDCTWQGDGDAPVSFEAVPDPGYVFVAWGGDCPDVLGDTCTATFEDGDEVTATFAPHALRLDLTGDGEGAFRISGGTVDTSCDADCGVALDRSLQLAIIYTAQGTAGTSETTLDAWTGACSGASQADYCLVTVSGAADVGKTWRHPPIATSDGYATWRNTPLVVPADDGVLADDTDTPGDPLTATVLDDVDDGTLVLDTDGGFEYVPDTGFEGQDGFTYRVQDAFGNQATATVTIAVVDRVPAAADDDYATTRNAPLVVAEADGVLANDADPDGDPLAADLIDEPTNGDVELAADGSFTYTPDLDFIGTDTFTYQATDGVTVSNLATVTITVANQAPVAQDDDYATTRNVTLDVAAADGVLANDLDPDGDDLTVTLVDDVDEGALTLAPDGGFSYNPNGAFVGTDSFTYQATDGDATSDVTTVTITVGNDAPIAAADAYEVLHGETLTIGVATGVLANDSDPDGDDLIAELLTNVSDGTLTLDADGSFTYTPDAGFAGPDTFTYQASDGVATSTETTVTITVTNDPPTAVADAYEVAHDTTLTRGAAAGVLANDSDPDGDALTAGLVSGPSDGTLDLNANGSFAYTPDPDFVGTDAFTYQAADGVGGTDTATVTITVTNDPPDAVADAYEVVHDTTLNRGAAVGVLANDSDPDGDVLTASLGTDVSDGTVTLNANGSFAYTPDPGFVGTDGFTYQAADGLGGTDTATVTITVTNDPPTAVNDPSYTTAADTPLVVGAAAGVLANDTDPDGDALTATVTADVANGTLTLNANGGFTYTPNAAYTGTDTFTYLAADGVGGTDTATATITVGP